MHMFQEVTEAIERALSDIKSTKGNVFVHFDRSSWDDDSLPSLDINIGPSDIEETNTHGIDWILSFNLVIRVKQNREYWQTILTIFEEAHVALRANYTLGLDYVTDILPVGTEGIRIDPGDETRAIMTTAWNVQLTTPLDNPST